MIDLDGQASVTRRYPEQGFAGFVSDVLGDDERPTKTLREIVVPTYQDRLYLAPADWRLTHSNDRLSQSAEGAFVLDVMLRDEPLPFDYVVMDTAPGKSALLVGALVAADEVVIPVQLSAMGFEGFVDIDRSINEARKLQKLRGEVRLEYRAVVPTFWSRGEMVSDGYLDQLRAFEHPDYPGEPLPLADAIVETTAFEQASVPVPIGDERRARTIFEMPAQGDDSPTARGQRAYNGLAEMVDGYV